MEKCERRRFRTRAGLTTPTASWHMKSNPTGRVRSEQAEERSRSYKNMGRVQLQVILVVTNQHRVFTLNLEQNRRLAAPAEQREGDDIIKNTRHSRVAEV